MSDPKSKPLSPGRSDVRFDFVDRLPGNVPPVEQPPTSMFPFPPPVGPADATYYFPLPLEGCCPTGVFFPDGYGYPDKINVIIYFHGHKAGEFETIDQYWKGLHNIRLREDINATGKKVVLIAPTMGPAPGSGLNKDMGIFRNLGGGDGFLEEVRQWIGKYVPQYSSRKAIPGIGNIVLAGHSGAGGILLQQAKSMRSHICEVWGFDSMYGMGWRIIGKDKKNKNIYQKIDVPGGWRDTAASHSGIEIDTSGFFPTIRFRPATKFYFYWAGSSVHTNAQALAEKVKEWGLTNVTIEANVHTGGSWAVHFESITANFKKRVTAAQCF